MRKKDVTEEEEYAADDPDDPEEDANSGDDWTPDQEVYESRRVARARARHNLTFFHVVVDFFFRSNFTFSLDMRFPVALFLFANYLRRDFLSALRASTPKFSCIYIYTI